MTENNCSKQKNHEAFTDKNETITFIFFSFLGDSLEAFKISFQLKLMSQISCEAS